MKLIFAIFTFIILFNQPVLADMCFKGGKVDIFNSSNNTVCSCSVTNNPFSAKWAMEKFRRNLKCQENNSSKNIPTQKKNNSKSTTTIVKGITFKGIHVGMNTSEQALVLKQNNYNCNNEKTTFYATEFVNCNNGKNNIKLFKDRIEFNSEVFNASGMSLKEILTTLVNNNFVSQFQFDPRNDSETARQYKRYCGRGSKGDILCVEDRLRPYGGIYITLDKGRLGKGKMKFN